MNTKRKQRTILKYEFLLWMQSSHKHKFQFVNLKNEKFIYFETKITAFLYACMVLRYFLFFIQLFLHLFSLEEKHFYQLRDLVSYWVKIINIPLVLTKIFQPQECDEKATIATRTVIGHTRPMLAHTGTRALPNAFTPNADRERRAAVRMRWRDFGACAVFYAHTVIMWEPSSNRFYFGRCRCHRCEEWNWKAERIFSSLTQVTKRTNKFNCRSEILLLLLLYYMPCDVRRKRCAIGENEQNERKTRNSFATNYLKSGVCMCDCVYVCVGDVTNSLLYFTIIINVIYTDIHTRCVCTYSRSGWK